MAKLTVEIVTAERQIYNETDVDMVVAPGSEGVLGILPRHASLLTMLRPGALRVKKGGTEQEMSVAGGFLIASGRGSLKYALPFGTFLAVGALVAATWGEPIADWYFGFYQ